MVFKKSAVKRTKSTDILPANEYNRKRADVVEELTSKRINVLYKKGGKNYVSEDSYSNDTMNVVLASPSVKGIPTRTALWHELSHVIHNSFGAGFFDTASDLAINQVKRMIANNPTLYQANATVTQHASSTYAQDTYNSYGMGETHLIEQLKQLYRMGFNAIEDQRIESLTGGVWYGTKKMFNKMRDSLGDRLLTNCKTMGNDAIDNPINQLLFIRFNHASDVPKADHKLSKAMDEVQGTDEFGSVVVWKRYVKPVIDKWFTNQIDKKMKEKEDELSKSISKAEDAEYTADNKQEQLEERLKKLEEFNSKTKLDSIFKNKEESNLRMGDAGKALVDKESYVQHTNRVFRKLDDSISKAKQDVQANSSKVNTSMDEVETIIREMTEDIRRDGASSPVANDTGMNKPTVGNAQANEGDTNEGSIARRCVEEGLDLDTDNTDEKDMSTMLVDSKRMGNEATEQIKNGLAGMSMPKNPSNIHPVARQPESNQTDATLVNGLSNIISKLKERNVPTLSDTGDEFDEDEYIDLKQRGHGNVFKVNKPSNGIPILVSIDGSGSMEANDNIDDARKLVSSLFKVAQRIPEISVEANVWSSDSNGDVAMTTIKTLADCKQITTHVTGGRYYETPTHEALTYSARRLKAMQGRHKMLILITDGYPQYSKNGTHLSNKTIITACKKSLRKVMQVTDNVICINVEPRGYSTGEMLKQIFGKRYVEYRGVKEANEFVSKTLKRKFIEVFRN